MQPRTRLLPRLLLALVVACGTATAQAQADNSNSKVEPAPSFSTWMMEHAQARQERVARDSTVWEAHDRRWMQERIRAGGIDDVNRYHGYPVDASPIPGDTTTGSIPPHNVTK